jgi:hypothetical protein
MKLKYMLAAGLMTATTFAQAQEWIADTIGTGMGYAQDGFYDLNATQSGMVANNNWDIAIVTGNAFNASVRVNHVGKGKNLRVYKVSENAAEDFGTNLVADTVGKTALENSPTIWDNGAFNQDADGPMSYGWGSYDMATHATVGNKVYAVINATGAYQVWIEQYMAKLDPADRLWVFHVANLDGTNPVTYEFVPEEFGNKFYAYFDLATGEFINREPDMDNWHLLATRYLDVYSPESPVLMSTTGIVTNMTVEVATASSIIADDANYEDYTGTYDSVMNVIGGKYKHIDYTAEIPGWVVYDSLSYFIKIKKGTGAGDIWQVYFDYFPTGTGDAVDVKIGLQKRKVYEAPTSAADVATPLNTIVVAPNPAANGRTTLVIDAKEKLNSASVSITDISGRVVYRGNTVINAGLQTVQLDLSNLVAGMYFVNVAGQGWSKSQKLIIK